LEYTVRNISAYFFAKALIAFGLTRKALEKAKAGEYILSIYFHNPSKNEFEFAVKWLMKYQLDFVSVEDLLKIRQGKIPFPKGAVMLTVDDGWASNEQNIVAIANEYKIPVTIFVSSEPVEKGNFWFNYARVAEKKVAGMPTMQSLKKVPNAKRLRFLKQAQKEIKLPREAMTPEQIERISKSPFITIGGHSHTHPILNQCTDQELKEDLYTNIEKLENWTQKEVIAFAYPNGDFGEREVQLLEKFDFMLGFANDPNYLTKDRLKNIFTIPRLGFREGASRAENICRICGVWKMNLSRLRFLKKGLRSLKS
jgi:poly-beta-1,6-N-acetyl-D-glucosamine N-deacetylase